MLFAGTAVSNGHGVGIVTAIGMATEIGKIQAQITAAAEEEEDTPLKQKLDEFGELLAKVCACLGLGGCKGGLVGGSCSWLCGWQGRMLSM